MTDVGSKARPWLTRNCCGSATRVAALEAALARGAVTALELRDATSSLAEAQMARRALEREHAVELGGLATAIGVDFTELRASSAIAWGRRLRQPSKASRDDDLID